MIPTPGADYHRHPHRGQSNLPPTPDELSLILPWLQEQDGNPEWPARVTEVLDDLSGRLDHGL
ncbi:MAG TPA: hypothetical protein VIV60_36575 [Polyangiaceae bacterium]